MYTRDDCTRVFESGGEVVIDYARPGEIFGIVGPHTRLKVRHGGQFGAPPFVVVGLGNARFTQSEDHNILNCKNIIVAGNGPDSPLVFDWRVHFRDDPGKGHHSGGLAMEYCQVKIPNNAALSVKVTPLPGLLIDGVRIVDSVFNGGSAYLGEPHWHKQAVGQKKEIANVVFTGNSVSAAHEGAQFKAATGVLCEGNTFKDILPSAPDGIWEGAIVIDDGTQDVLIKRNAAHNCYGCGVAVSEHSSGTLDIYANLFTDCARRPYKYYPGVIYVSKRGKVRVFNNTIIGSGVNGVHFSGDVPDAVTRNNIILDVSGTPIRAKSFDPGGPNHTDTDYTVDSYGFADGYQLTADSPGVAAGVAHPLLGLDMKKVPYLDPPSMGCYQFAGGEPEPPETSLVVMEGVTYRWIPGDADGAYATGKLERVR